MRLLAAAIVGSCGLALSAAGQDSVVSISRSSDNGGTSTIKVTRMIDKVEHHVEIVDGKVTKATIDGLNVEHEIKDGQVLLKGGEGSVVRIEIPEPGDFELRGLDGLGAELDGLGMELNRLGSGPMVWRVNEPKAMVGLMQSDLSEQLRDHLELDEGVGTVIVSVVDGLPAQKAGLTKGDVLIEVDGKKVKGQATLTDAIAELEPGDSLALTVLRKGTPMSFDVELVKYEGRRLWHGGDEGNHWGFLEGFEDGTGLDELIRELQRDGKIDEQELIARLSEARQRAEASRLRAMERMAQIQPRLNELLIRPEGVRPRIVEIAPPAPAPAPSPDLAELNRALERRNQELEARLEAMEARLDRLLEALEAQERRKDE
jgi:hypothetical protein